MIDQPKSVRAGEELNGEHLRQYLTQTLGPQEHLEVKQFPGGYSNLTYAIEWGHEAFILRRPPFGANVKAGHDMEREHRVLTMLLPVYDKIPKPIAFCGDLEVLGAPFYLMERVKGVILRPPAPEQLTPAVMTRLSEMLIDNLADLHALDLEKTGLNQLGKPEGYTTRQVEGWIGRYEKAQTDDVTAMTEAAKWLRANIPPERYVSLLHNDYKYDNVVFDTELSVIRAMLDWEMATVGDPLADLGLMLAYWTEATDPKAMQIFNLSNLTGNLTRQQLAERYTAKTGRDLSHILFYYVLGQYKLAVILQQIYYRFVKGHTKDQRFSAFGQLMQVGIGMGIKALERGGI
jgi:aminoglycoside phosphotransferase (APT) family kinase protein